MGSQKRGVVYGFIDIAKTTLQTAIPMPFCKVIFGQDNTFD
jgi:hypothetical protein